MSVVSLQTFETGATQNLSFASPGCNYSVSHTGISHLTGKKTISHALGVRRPVSGSYHILDTFVGILLFLHNWVTRQPLL